MPLSLSGCKSVAFASFVVSATLALSMFPTNSGDVVQQAEVQSDKRDFNTDDDLFDTYKLREDINDDCGEIIMLEDFTSPKHKWVEMNDPVMGGKSTGTFSVDDTQHVGVFHGSVEIVDFLSAPGFIKAETTKGESWPDASSCEGLRFVLKSSTPSYEGFRVSFGSKRPKGAFPYTYGFKTSMVLDGSTTDFQTIELPFDQFTDKWDPATGDAVVTCADNKEFCPEEEDKKALYSIAVWGEGVKGDVDLKIQSVSAYGCKSIRSGCSEEGILPVGDDTIAIEDFSNPNHEWRTMNDPVMGGQSTSSVSIAEGIASFEGTCAIVPFLHAPGFITMTTGVHVPPGRLFGLGHSHSSTSSSPVFPDVSGCEGLAVTLRTSVDYEGYYVSFGTDKVPGGHHASGYKTHLDLEASDDFVEMKLPFSDFSSKWDDATGKTTVTCQEDPQYCPSLDNLQDMKTISFWGEGVEGTVALDVKHIGAYGCASMDDSLVASANLQGIYYQSTIPNNAILFLGVALASMVVATAIFGRSLRKAYSRHDYEEINDFCIR